MAEGAGFEPAVELPLRLISSQVPSTNSATLPVMPGSQVSLRRGISMSLLGESKFIVELSLKSECNAGP